MSGSSERASRLHALERSRFLILIVCLLGMLAILPALPQEVHRAMGIDIALLALLLACLWSMGHRKSLIVVGTTLLVPAFAAAWFANDASGPLLALIGLSCALAFLAITAITMLMDIVRKQDVSTDTILGGICVYMLFAVIWAVVFEIIERAHPGAFDSSSAADHGRHGGRLVSPDFIYYSIFTLSTIGPQDVHPISGAARSWTGLEAIVGQLYLAVLIARLVGRHSSRN